MMSKVSVFSGFKKTHFIAAASVLVVCFSICTVAYAADIENGKKMFVKCQVCHSLEKDVSKLGPSLHGVFGRKSGTLPSYTKYSEAMKTKATVWDDKNMFEFLAAPRTYVKGTKMIFIGLKDEQQRQDLIDYIKSVSDAPSDAPSEKSK